MMVAYDVVVIGGGPGGLAAAAAAKRAGAGRVLLLEREDRVGGILNQCIHDGFGLHRYKAPLSGPEYADRSRQEAVEAGVELRTGCMVTHISPECEVTVISREGMLKFAARSLVLATGCRERTRGAISIPGSRPAGVFTAGVAQNLINEKNVMIGKRVVILGSGDIGLIMARRLTLEGAAVLAVIEIMPTPGGLARNVAQCLYDFDIPLYLEHTVSRIIGKKHLTAVEIAKVDQNRDPIPGSERMIECDALVLSVGLIPENELAKDMGIQLDSRTNGVLTDSCLQTNIPGVFSCGNSRRVMDLADFVSKQGELAGANAAAYVLGSPLAAWDEKAADGQMKKGLPTPGSVLCTLCPNGCELTLSNGAITGNRCPRGAEFGRQEFSAPKRTLTTTMRTADGKLLPVRSDVPIPKQMLAAVVDVCKHQTVAPGRQIGEVLISNVLDTGANMVATAG